MGKRDRALAALVLAASWAVCAPAAADGFAMESPRSQAGAEDSILLARPGGFRSGRWTAQLSTDYARDPLAVRDGPTIISNRTVATAGTTYGLSEHLALALMFPYVLHQRIDETAARAGPLQLDAAGPGDLRLHARVLLARSDQGLAWGATVDWLLPTGSEAALASDGEAASGVATQLSYDTQGVTIAADVGLEFGAGVPLDQATPATDLRCGLGLFREFGSLRLGLEFAGRTGLQGDRFLRARFSPARLALSGRMAFDRLWVVLAPAMGLVAEAPGTPLFRVLLHVGGVLYEGDAR